jgi:hypothetical protein
VNVQAIVIGAVICSFLGLIIGSTKGQGGAGFFLGALLGPLGLILCLIMKPTPAIAAAREEAIEAERARLRAQRDGTSGTPGTERPADR